MWINIKSTQNELYIQTYLLFCILCCMLFPAVLHSSSERRGSTNSAAEKMRNKHKHSNNLTHVVIDGSPEFPGKACEVRILEEYGQDQEGGGFWCINTADLLRAEGFISAPGKILAPDDIVLRLAGCRYDEGIAAGYHRFVFVGLGKTAKQIDWMIRTGILQGDRCIAIMIVESLVDITGRHGPEMEAQLNLAYLKYCNESDAVRSVFRAAGLCFKTVDFGPGTKDITEKVLRYVGTLCPIPGRKLRVTKPSGTPFTHQQTAALA